MHLLKVLDERPGEHEYVRARHILFTLGADSVEVKRRADSVAAALRTGADFAALAGQFSQDPGSASRGGDLGWFTRGRMTPTFEEAAFGAARGQIVGPFRSPFGLHILEVTGRDNREVKLAYITMRIEVSPQTRNDLYERAADFAHNARQTEFSSEAGQMGFTVQETNIQEEGGVIPGIGVNESVSRWAFNKSAGDISEPFSVPSGYAVFAIAKVTAAGVRPFAEVKESIRPLALREARIDRAVEIAQGVRNELQPGEGLTRVSVLKPAIEVRTAESFTLSGSIPGVGRDQAFLGTVAGLQPGEVSPAVRSARGAYLIELLSRTSLDSTAFAAQKETLRGRALQEKRNQVLTAWLEGLRRDADIEDHRDLFYR
jgi:peptidyl-prolyl cis-trans isomerase D